MKVAEKKVARREQECLVAQQKAEGTGSAQQGRNKSEKLLHQLCDLDVNCVTDVGGLANCHTLLDESAAERPRDNQSLWISVPRHLVVAF